MSNGRKAGTSWFSASPAHPNSPAGGSGPGAASTVPTLIVEFPTRTTPPNQTAQLGLKARTFDLAHRAFAVYCAIEYAKLRAPIAILAETGYAIWELVVGFVPALLFALSVIGLTTAVGAVGGAALGAPAGGIGAVPGAVFGAELGLEAGLAFLNILGLGILLIYAAQNLDEAFHVAEAAAKRAWEAPDHPRTESAEIRAAGEELARALGIAFRVILQGVVAYLISKGVKSASARVPELVAKLRASGLGAGFAEWIERHWPSLLDDPRLQPKPESGGSSSASGPKETEIPASAKPAPNPTLKPPSRYVGKLGSKKVTLEGVSTKRIDYLKRPRTQYAELRKQFDAGARQRFLKDMANDPRQLQALEEAGIDNSGLQRMRDGRVPEGWQVHHKIPLDDGGTNDPSNLVLIKNNPAHQVLTNAQSSLVGDLTEGQMRSVDFPVPEGQVYPPNPSMVHTTP